MPNMALWCCCGGCIPGTAVDPQGRNYCVGCGTDSASTPNAYDLTFSGITICPGCFTANGVDVQVEFINGFSPNSVFRVLQYSDDNFPPSVTEEAPCLYLYDTPGDVLRVTQYDTSDGTCGAVDIVIDSPLRIRLGLNGGTTWRLQMGIASPNQQTDGGTHIFCDTAALLTSGGDGDCSALPSFTNALATCGATSPGNCFGVGGSFVGATGGSATGVCVE